MTEVPQSDDRFPDPSKAFRLAWFLISWLPNRRGSRLRVPLLRRAGATVGDGARIGPGVRVYAPKGLTIGKAANISRDAVIDARAGLTIGAGAVIGFESVLLTWAHRFDNVDVAVTTQGFDAKPIVVGELAWVGARAFVMPGVAIGDHAIVGTASLVTKDVPPGVVVGGVPAKVIRDR
jgi:acetyltransferase-like isoleucine patch superfamily enzyme